MSLDSTLKLGNKIKELEDEIAELKQYVAVNKSKIDFYDACIVTNSCVKFKDCYKELGFKSTKALGDYLIYDLEMCYRDDKHKIMFKQGFENYFAYRKFYIRGFQGIHLVLRREGYEMLKLSVGGKRR